MHAEELDELLLKGIEAAEKGYIHSAQVFIGQVIDHRKTPEAKSYQAYCLAKGQGRLSAAIKICRESIKREPENSLHYLILGRILLLAGEKRKAINAFRKGLKIEPNPKIVEELKRLGLRRPAVIKSLDRNHPLNRILGKTLSRLGLR